jgi:hypothetical protein
MLPPVQWPSGCYVLMDTMFLQVLGDLGDMAYKILIGEEGFN